MLNFQNLLFHFTLDRNVFFFFNLNYILIITKRQSQLYLGNKIAIAYVRMMLLQIIVSKINKGYMKLRK